MQSAADVIISIDSDGLVHLANPAAVSHFGYALSELIGMPVAKLFDPQSGWEQVWRSAIGGTFSIRSKELLTVRRNGSLSYMEASASRWNWGRITSSPSFCETRRSRTLDLHFAQANHARASAEALAELNRTLEQRVEDRTTQLMRAEEALRQSQKMEAIGQLTGGIAHDFNNLLQGITGSLHVIQKLITAGRIGEIDRFVVGARESANRAASLTHRLLAFSRQQPIDPRPVDVNKLITSIQELVRRTIGETITMTLIPAKALWLIRCDENQLQNAILNLAINARDAMPHGSTITFHTANKTLISSEARTRELEPGNRCFSIKDPAKVYRYIQARVFERFLHQGIGKGTGRIAMIYGFVKHPALDKIDSEWEREPQSILLLDIAANWKTHIERTQGSIAISVTWFCFRRRRRRSLLVVDVLKELGYYALEADSGSSRCASWIRRQRIDLLIRPGLPDVSAVRLPMPQSPRARVLKCY